MHLFPVTNSIKGCLCELPTGVNDTFWGYAAVPPVLDYQCGILIESDDTQASCSWFAA